MTGTRRALYRGRHLLWIVAALLFLGGAVGVAYLKIDAEASARKAAIAEANLRGDAVSTLAGDVRALREQVKAHGGTPVAPDPSRAVPSLNARAEVPVPIPGPVGPSGAAGPSGAPGTPGPSGPAGQTGPSGAPGVGATGPVGPAGPAGPRGDVGPAGRDGSDGADGQQPSGWTFTDGTGVTQECTPDGDGSTHYTCEPASSPSTPVDPSAALLVGATVFTKRSRGESRGDRAGRGRHRAPGRGGTHR